MKILRPERSMPFPHMECTPLEQDGVSSLGYLYLLPQQRSPPKMCFHPQQTTLLPAIHTRGYSEAGPRSFKGVGNWGQGKCLYGPASYMHCSWNPSPLLVHEYHS